MGAYFNFHELLIQIELWLRFKYYQSTGLCLCWSKYGDFSLPSLFSFLIFFMVSIAGFNTVFFVDPLWPKKVLVLTELLFKIVLDVADDSARNIMQKRKMRAQESRLSTTSKKQVTTYWATGVAFTLGKANAIATMTSKNLVTPFRIIFWFTFTSMKISYGREIRNSLTYSSEMVVSSASCLRILQSLDNFSDDNKVEDDEARGNNDVNDCEHTSIYSVEISEQTNNEIHCNNHQHDHEERNLKLG